MKLKKVLKLIDENEPVFLYECDEANQKSGIRLIVDHKAKDIPHSGAKDFLHYKVLLIGPKQYVNGIGVAIFIIDPIRLGRRKNESWMGKVAPRTFRQINMDE